jgi:hypothetical protein
MHDRLFQEDPDWMHAMAVNIHAPLSFHVEKMAMVVARYDVVDERLFHHRHAFYEQNDDDGGDGGDAKEMQHLQAKPGDCLGLDDGGDAACWHIRLAAFANLPLGNSRANVLAPAMEELDAHDALLNACDSHQLKVL